MIKLWAKQLPLHLDYINILWLSIYYNLCLATLILKG